MYKITHILTCGTNGRNYQSASTVVYRRKRNGHRITLNPQRTNHRVKDTRPEPNPSKQRDPKIDRTTTSAFISDSLRHAIVHKLVDHYEPGSDPGLVLGSLRERWQARRGKGTIVISVMDVSVEVFVRDRELVVRVIENKGDVECGG